MIRRYANSRKSFSEEWTFVSKRGVKAYPHLNESVWITDRPPHGFCDKIALHRLVKTDTEPRGVVLFLPGARISGEALISNPHEDNWTMQEKHNLPYYLANRDFDIYAIDYRTHFVSEDITLDRLSFMVDWGWDMWINDIKEAVNLAKRVSVAKRIYIAGQSFGGLAAMNFASAYWKEDLKGIILLDGSSGGKNQRLVTNTYNLTVMINKMKKTRTWARGLEGFSLYKYAAAHPDGPAVNPWTRDPLEPTINPWTEEPWINITEWAGYALYVAFGPGQWTNIYEGYGKPDVMVQAMSRMDRYWPTRVSLETSAIEDWDNCPYVTNDFDDHWCEIDVPLLGFRSELFGVKNRGPFIHGISNPDFTGIILQRYGHLDVYFGEYSERDVSVPTYLWLVDHTNPISSSR